MPKRKLSILGRRANQKKRLKHYESKLTPSRDSSDFMRHYRLDMVAAAKGGDREAAIEILNDYRNDVDCGHVPPSEYLIYFAECFTNIVRGELPTVSLHLNNPRHRPKDANLQGRDTELAVDVGIMLTNGIPLKRAKIETAQRRRVSVDVVERAYQLAKKTSWYSDMLQQWQQLFYDPISCLTALPSVSDRKK